MRAANGWKQYRILDTSEQEKLESWNGVTLVRPDPQVIWKTPRRLPAWRSADGHYSRSSSGGGSWAFSRKLPESWKMQYAPLGLTFKIQPPASSTPDYFRSRQLTGSGWQSAFAMPEDLSRC